VALGNSLAISLTILVVSISILSSLDYNPETLSGALR
jgi:hypothetical protein